MAFVSAWTDLACRGGARILDVVSAVPPQYGQALDNTEGCTIEIDSADTTQLAALALANVLRFQTGLAALPVVEYLINNARATRTAPTAIITGKPVEAYLNRAMVKALDAGGRVSTAISGQFSATDWRDQFILPSLALAGQTWWSAGVMNVTKLFQFQFVDKTCMYLAKQILQYETAILRATRVGETGYTLDFVNLSVAATPIAEVGRNVTVLDYEIDDLEQATVITPAGMQASGTDEPDRIWYVPWRAASVASTAVTLDDPTGQSTTILGSDLQPFLGTVDGTLSSLNWRLGVVTPPVLWSTAKLWRVLYLPATTTAWGAFNTGLRSMNTETRVLGTLQTTSLTKAVDIYYNAGSGKAYIADIAGARVTPYTLSGPTAGTPIAVGIGPRRLVYVTDGALNRLLVGHGNANGITGANLLEQIDPTTDTVTATSPAMTTPAHIAVISKTQVYLASDTIDAVYRYNASLNTVTTTIVSGLSGNVQNQPANGYASAVYCAAQAMIWACQHRTLTTPNQTAISIIDPATDTIVAYLPTTALHGQIVDCLVVAGLFYGVTDDGLLVCYDPATRALLWTRRHAAWPAAVLNGGALSNGEGTWVLQSIDYLATLDCFAIGAYSGAVYFMDAQTGGAVIGRALTAASAATPSVTLANSVFPIRQYDECVFCRNDARPLIQIPNSASVSAYGVKERTATSAQLLGGSNRVNNGAMAWFDSSRKAARFLNLTLPDATSEAKWDGYTDNTVLSYTAAVNGAQATVQAVGQSLALKSAGAARVLLPGDLIVGSTDFTVLAKATADGAGNVTVWAAASNGSGVADSAVMTVYRPNATQLLAQAPTWVVLPIMGVASAGARSTLFADVLLPFIPGEMANLYWGITGFVFGVNGTPNQWRLRLLGADGQSALVDTQWNPDLTALYPGRGPVSMSFTSLVPLPIATAGGHLQFNIQPVDALQASPTLMALYLAQVWVQVGNVDRGPPTKSAQALWQLGQDAGVLRGSGSLSYTVQALEDDPAAPFVLGATVTLRDPERGILNATPKIVKVVRTPPVSDEDVPLPQLTLDSRQPAFVDYVIRTQGGF